MLPCCSALCLVQEHGRNKLGLKTKSKDFGQDVGSQWVPSCPGMFQTLSQYVLFNKSIKVGAGKKGQKESIW